MLINVLFAWLTTQARPEAKDCNDTTVLGPPRHPKRSNAPLITKKKFMWTVGHPWWKTVRLSRCCCDLSHLTVGAALLGRNACERVGSTSVEKLVCMIVGFGYQWDSPRWAAAPSGSGMPVMF